MLPELTDRENEVLKLIADGHRTASHSVIYFIRG